MAKYSISYSRPGEPPAIHELEAKSEPEARMRFLNLSWIAFTPITINSIALKGDQAEAPAARKPAMSHAADAAPYLKAALAPKRVIKAAMETAKKPTFQEFHDPAAQIARLTAEINALADEAQALTRAGPPYDAADALRAKAKQLAA